MRNIAVVAALLLLAPALSLADTITVHVRAGYPVPSRGSAALELTLVRPVTRQSVASDAVEAVFREVEAALAEAGISDDWALLVPDAKSIHIRAEIGGRTTTLASCHPFFENDPRLVVTARGVESLGSRSRIDVIDAQPRSFQRGRNAFDRSLAAITRFLQTKGEVFP